jgi:hypothetical protein
MAAKLARMESIIDAALSELAIQWISVLIYNLEMKGSPKAETNDPVVLDDEIRYWEKRRKSFPLTTLT